jgi:hypothetical protein
MDMGRRRVSLSALLIMAILVLIGTAAYAYTLSIQLQTLRTQLLRVWSEGRRGPSGYRKTSKGFGRSEAKGLVSGISDGISELGRSNKNQFPAHLRADTRSQFQG